MLEALKHNLVYGLRMLKTNRGFSVTAILTLALAMQSTLHGVGAFDALAFEAVLILLLVAAGLACLLPAFRASSVEPIVALRHE